MSNFFWTVINNISSSSIPIPKEEFCYNEYNPYVIIKVLSYNIELTNRLLPFNYNIFKIHDKYLHYLSLYYKIPKKIGRKFTMNKEKLSDVDKSINELIGIYYSIRYDIAVQYRNILTEEQINYFKEIVTRK